MDKQTKSMIFVVTFLVIIMTLYYAKRILFPDQSIYYAIQDDDKDDICKYAGCEPDEHCCNFV